MGLFRYIKGTLDYGLLYQSRREWKINLQDYADADRPGDVVTRKSTSGFKVRAALVSWSSKPESVVALSSTEAEYIGLSHATQELQNIVTEEYWIPLRKTKDNIQR